MAFTTTDPAMNEFDALFDFFSYEQGLAEIDAFYISAPAHPATTTTSASKDQHVGADEKKREDDGETTHDTPGPLPADDQMGHADEHESALTVPEQLPQADPTTALLDKGLLADPFALPIKHEHTVKDLDQRSNYEESQPIYLYEVPSQDEEEHTPDAGELVQSPLLSKDNDPQAIASEWLSDDPDYTWRSASRLEDSDQSSDDDVIHVTQPRDFPSHDDEKHSPAVIKAKLRQLGTVSEVPAQPTATISNHWDDRDNYSENDADEYSDAVESQTNEANATPKPRDTIKSNTKTADGHKANPAEPKGTKRKPPFNSRRKAKVPRMLSSLESDMEPAAGSSPGAKAGRLSGELKRLSYGSPTTSPRKTRLQLRSAPPPNPAAAARRRHGK